MTAKQLDDLLRKSILFDERSVTQLAYDAGVSQSSLHRYLAGERGISWVGASKLLAELGFKLEKE